MKKVGRALKNFLAVNLLLIIPIYFGVMWNMYCTVAINAFVETPLSVKLSDGLAQSVDRVAGCAIGLEGYPAVQFVVANPYRMGNFSFEFSGGPAEVRLDEITVTRARLVSFKISGEDILKNFVATENARMEQRDNGVFLVLSGNKGSLIPNDGGVSWSSINLVCDSFSVRAKFAFVLIELILFGFSVLGAFFKARELKREDVVGYIIIASMVAVFVSLIIPFQSVLQTKAELEGMVSLLFWKFVLKTILSLLIFSLFFLLMHESYGMLFPALAVMFIVYEYIQISFLSVGFPPLDGSFNFYNDKIRALRDIACILLLFIGTMCGLKWFRKYFVWIACVVVIMSAASLFDVMAVQPRVSAKDDSSYDEWNCSLDEVLQSFRWSLTRNVVLIIPDTLQADVSLDVIRSSPEIARYYRGFTGFSNNVGTHKLTVPSVPAMLTGHYHDGCESEADMIDRLKSEESCLYPFYIDRVPMSVMTEVRYTNRARAIANADESSTVATHNVEQDPSLKRYSTPPYLNLNDYVLYRLFPFAVKRAILETAGIGVKTSAAKKSDGVVYPLLSNISIDPTITNNLNVIHTLGLHLPLHYDKFGAYHDRMPQNYETMRGQAYYVLTQIGRFLNVLKENGVYDNSIIVIAGDHGSDAATTRIMNGEPVYGRCAPMIWVKPIGESGDFVSTTIPTASINLHKIIRESKNRNLTIEEVSDMLRQNSPRLWRHSMHGEMEEIEFDIDGHIIRREKKKIVNAKI